MRRERWAVILVVLVGLAIGLVVSGPPTRRSDPELRLRVEATTTTTVFVPTTPPPPPPETTTTTTRRSSRGR